MTIKFKFTATIEVPDADKFPPKERAEKDLMEWFISEGMIPHELKLIDYYVEQGANDAIDAWRREYPLDLQEPIDDCWNSIRELPAVQPDHTADIGKKVCVDTISRQEALKELAAYIHLIDKTMGKGTLTDDDCMEAAESVLGEDELPAAQPEPKWIPCSKRLPERADNVIICYKAGDYTLVSTGRYLYKFKMWYVDVVGDLRDGVAAWMPLPEPYK